MLVHLRAGSGWLGVASLGMKAAGAFVEHTRGSAYDYFSGWRQLPLPAFESQLHRLAVVRGHCRRPPGTEDVVLVELGGVTLGWIDHGDDCTGPFVRSQESESAAMRALAHCVWEHIGSDWCVLDTVLDDSGNVVPTFSADELRDAPSSVIATQAVERMRPMLERGYMRSAMFYGPPGTGKSCAMRYVAKALATRVLRVSIQTLDDDDHREAVVPAVRLLQPDALLIDDFDRMDEEGKFLYELERLRHHVKLLLVSANRVRYIDEAIIRHGRFDDMIPVVALDREAADGLIGDGLSPSVRAKLRKLPASALEEFRRLRDTFGLKAAVKEIAGLERRRKDLARAIEGKKKRRKRKKKVASKPAVVEGIPDTAELHVEDPKDRVGGKP